MAVRWTTNEHRSHFRLNKYCSHFLTLNTRRTKLPVSTVRPLLKLVVQKKNPHWFNNLLPRCWREEEVPSPTGMLTNTTPIMNQYSEFLFKRMTKWGTPPFLWKQWHEKCEQLDFGLASLTDIFVRNVKGWDFSSTLTTAINVVCAKC